MRRGRRRTAGVGAIALMGMAAGPASRPASQPASQPAVPPPVVVVRHEPVIPPPLPVTRPATAPAVEPARVAVRPPPAATAPAGVAPLVVPDPVAYGAGYAAGRRVRQRLSEDGLTFDQLTVVQGVIDALADKDAKYAAADTRAAVEQVAAAVLQRRAERRAADDPAFRRLADDNAAHSAAVLAENARRVGVRIQPDGVQVQVVHGGTGRPVGAAPVAVARLSVELADGTGLAIGEAPARLALAEVLPALASTVRTMRVGDGGG